jgi:tetratricopeptide (TPR) repeat protein
VRGINLRELTEEEALRLLRAGEERFSDEDLTKLATRLGYLTLALAVSASIMAEGMLPAELLQRLNTEGATAFAREQDDPTFRKCPDLVKLFDISLQLVMKDRARPEERELARHMLGAGGWFANAPIPLELLGHAAAMLGPGLVEVAPIEAIRLLVKYGLGARAEDGRVSFHRLVQDYGQHLGGKEAGEAMLVVLWEEGQAASHTAHFQNACDLALPHLGGKKLVLQELKHNIIVAKILVPLVRHYNEKGLYLLGRDAMQGVDAATLLEVVQARFLDVQANTLDKCGQFKEALPLSERALLLAEKFLKPEDPRIAGFLTSLGNGLNRQGRCEAALSHYQRAVRLIENGTCPNPSFLLTVLNNMALCLTHLGKYQEALELFQRALNLSVETGGQQSYHISSCLYNIGSLLRTQGKYEEAYSFHLRCLKLREKQQGLNHPDVAKAESSLADLLTTQGKFEEAYPHCERAERILDISVGLDNPTVGVDVLHTKAVLMIHRGELEEALQLYQRILRIQEAAFGPNHSQVAACLTNMGFVHRERGDSGEALPLFQKALSISERALGPHHEDVAIVLDHIAVTLTSQGEHGKALPLSQRALAGLKRALGPAHHRVGMSLNNMANILKAQGKYKEALLMYEEALLVLGRAVGAAHPDTSTACSGLEIMPYMEKLQDMVDGWCDMASFLEGHSRHREALRHYHNVLDTVGAGLTTEHPTALATILNNMARLLQKVGEYGEAESLSRRALLLFEKALGTDDSSVAMCLDNIAGLLKSQGRAGEAIPLYEKGLRISQEMLGLEHLSMVTTLRNLGDTFMAEGQNGRAAESYRKALYILEVAPLDSAEDFVERLRILENTLVKLAKLVEIQGEYEDARLLFQRASDMRESCPVSLSCSTILEVLD